MSPLLILPFSKNNKIMIPSDPVTEICLTLLMFSLAYGQGRIEGGRLRSMHPANFKSTFDVYNFSKIFKPL